jgi:hypothetical protein
MGTTSPYISLKALEWQSNLAKTSLSTDDREELTAHMDDVITELIALGLSDEEVWAIAAKRIGSISTIESEFEKVNPDIPFRRNGLLMVYGAIIMLFLQSFFIMVPAFTFRNDQKENADLLFLGLRLWPIVFNILIVMLISIILIFIFKGKILARALSNFAFRLNIFSAFISAAVIVVSAFFTIQLIGLSEVDKLHTVAPKFKTLSQLFYLGLMGLIGYFLLIGNNRNVRTLLSFNRKLHWKTSLLLGGIACLAVIFSYTYGLAYLPLIIGCPLFAVLGWMVSFSKKKSINLFCSQLFLMLFLFSELGGRYVEMFTKYYFITLVFLLIGAFYQKTFDYLSRLFSNV